MEPLSQKLIAFVRAAIDREAASKWERLRRVPSTYTWKCLDQVSLLRSSQRQELFNALAGRAPVLLGLEPPPVRWTDPVLVRFSELVMQRRSPHVSARLLRGMLAAMRSDGPQGLFAGLPKDVIERAEAIEPTNAAQIRKQVKLDFGGRYAAKPENLGGGNWRYRGVTSGRSFSVLVDYGGQVDQLRYWVQFCDGNLQTRTLSYEALLGMGFGHWDFVTATNLQESVQLLCELIEEVVAIPERLAMFDYK